LLSHPIMNPLFCSLLKYLFCFYRHLCWYWCSGIFSFVVSCDPTGRFGMLMLSSILKRRYVKKKKMWVEQGTHKKHMVCIHISKFVHSSISLLLLFS
jgi:hypothetical protein